MRDSADFDDYGYGVTVEEDMNAKEPQLVPDNGEGDGDPRWFSDWPLHRCSRL
jgi:hypothetical protein